MFAPHTLALSNPQNPSLSSVVAPFATATGSNIVRTVHGVKTFWSDQLYFTQQSLQAPLLQQGDESPHVAL